MRKHRSKASAQTIAASARRARAVELRKAGKSYREIAAEIGCTVKNAHRHVQKALASTVRNTQESVDEHRELELERIDKIIASLMPLVESTGDPAVADKVLKAADLRAKLLGLYAPAKAEVTGKNGAPIAVSWASIVAAAKDEK